MSALKLTSDQARAINPASHIWVDASAGTGKTHVLTARVLRLMLGGARPDSILCLTYTKAAAGEMVNRILGQLGAWAVMDEAALKTDLATLLGGASLVTPEHRMRARALFLDVLDLPNGLQVQTLHAFSQSLLGRFPLESQTPPAFETIDERTVAEFAADARAALYEAALLDEEAPLARALSHMATLLADQSFEAAAKEFLTNRALIERLPKEPDRLSDLVHQALAVSPNDSADNLLRAGASNASFDLLALRAVAKANALHGTNTEKNGRAKVLADWLAASVDQRIDTFDAYASIYLTSKGIIKAEKNLAASGIKKALPNVIEIMTREGERLQDLKAAITLKQLAEETVSALLFGQHMVARYGQRKAHAGKLDYDDLIERTRALLDGGVPPDWVMFRLDAQIDHILVDEAQDNSAVQWTIVKRLTEEFFAGDAGRDTPRSLFAVGDMKQSIYGFQGAEPALFAQTQARVKNDAADANQAFDKVEMNTSFRSVQAVLDVVDAAFAGEAGTGLDIGVPRIQHRSNRRGIGGMVDLWPITSAIAIEDDQGETGWRLPLEDRHEMKADRRLAEQIAKDIEHRIAARECLPGRSTPLSAGDFLILVRRRSDFMSHMARALKQRGVPIAGLDRFDLKSPLVVRDLINLGRFASLPQDDYALACVLKGPLCDVDEQALMSLCATRTGTLWAHVKDNPAVSQHTRTLLARVLAMADQVAPFEFYSKLLVDSGRVRLAERMGTEADDAINVFLDQCLHYEQGHTPSLDGFLHWLGQSDVDVKRDPEAAGEKVRIMTVHGAKGLQAPVVYLPDLVGLPRSKGTLLPVKTKSGHKDINVPIFRRREDHDVGPVAAASAAKQAEAYYEYKRLLYVAMTRAEDHLICCGFSANGKANANTSGPDAYTLVSAAFERLDDARLTDIDGALRYEMAQDAPVPPHTSDDNVPRPAVLPVWAKTPPPDDPIPPRPLQPSQGDLAPDAAVPAASLNAATNALSPIRRGQLIHALLEHLPSLPQQERQAAGVDYLTRALTDAQQGSAQALLEDALSVLSLKDLAPLFSEDSRAEAPIVARLGSFIVSGQVDRLAITSEAVVFAEYKTAHQPPADAAATSRAILQQMALYQASLELAFPGKDVCGALVWTAAPRVDWLARDWLLTHLPAGANTAFTGAQS